MTITAEQLRDLLDYDPETGVFTWARTVSPTGRKGNVAGCKSKAGNSFYWKIRIKRKLYNAHRLAWLYVHGEWPTDEIDHIDRNGLNNAIANLREASSSLNKLNRVRHKGTTAWRGVQWRSDMGRWIAQMSHKGRSIHIGTFDCPAAASLAYQTETQKLHGHCSLD